MHVRQTGFRGVLLGAAITGVVCRNARTVALSRQVVELRPVEQVAVRAATVTVVVPARNEQAVLHDCLGALRAQTYGAHAGGTVEGPALRIVLVDDGSSDATGAIAHEHAAEDSRVSVVRVEGPPPGWTGKVHALHVGMAAVGELELGDWLLFVDADTVLAPDALARLIATANAVGADLVSTPGGPPPGRSASWPLLMPQGLQMIAENATPTGRGRKAFAIGHCILVRRPHYEKMGGWAALHALRNEDIAIATAVRDHGGCTRIVDGLDHVSTRGMDPLRQGWRSFRKSFVAGTRGSVPVLLGAGLGQIALSVVAPAAATIGVRKRHLPLAAAGLVGWAAQSAAHWHTAKLMRARPSLAPLAPLTGALFGSVLLDGALRVLRGTLTWKERRSGAPHAPERLYTHN